MAAIVQCGGANYRAFLDGCLRSRYLCFYSGNIGASVADVDTLKKLVGGYFYGGGVQRRYRYRIEPTPDQTAVLAWVFGCCRVVFNDALRVRQ